MTGPRTIVFVGATSGLGRSAAGQLAADGHRLVLVGQDPERARDLEAELPGVRVITGDAATRAGIQELARRIGNDVDQVDTLVNNAGVMLPTRRVTPDGTELNLAVHHLAPYSMTSELLPLLQRGDGRIVNVNSEGHRAALFRGGPIEIDFTDLGSERSYDPFIAYSRTKLASLMFTYELQRRHPELTAVAVHPGMVRTDLGRHFPRIQVAAMHAISRSAHYGGAPVAYLAAAPDISAGAYYNRFARAPSSAASRDPVAARRLWEVTERMRGTFGLQLPAPR
jgi:NAD(P)-dependent dehydrogenase (short-subunit alcohol dehydrogenase family)